MEKENLNFGSKISKNILDSFIFGSILLVFLLVPVFFTGLVAQGLGFEKVILFYFLTLIGVVAWVIKGAVVGELKLKRTPLDLPILIAFAFFTLSTILSISPKDSLIGSYGSSVKGLAAFIAFVLFYYLVVNNLTRDRIKYIFGALIFSSILIIVYSILQLNGVFILGAQFTNTIKFNPLGSLSGLSKFLIIVLPLFVVGAAKIGDIFNISNNQLKIFLKVVFSVAIIGVFVLLAALSGFTEWPIGVVGMVIVLMFFLSKIITVKTSDLLIPLASFLAMIVFLVLGNFMVNSLNLPAEVSLSKGASWEIAKGSLRENPIFGSGLSTFYYDFAKFRSIDFNNTPLWNIRFDSASGFMFELLSTVGILGAISILVLILISISVSFLTLARSKKKEGSVVLLGLFASFISSIFFASLFSLNNSLILFSVLIAIFTVAVAVINSDSEHKVLNLSFKASPNYSLALAAIVLCVSAGVVVLFTLGIKMYAADMHIRKSMTITDNSKKLVEIQRAINLAPYQDNYYLSAANSYMAIANKAAIDGSDKNSIELNLHDAIEKGKKAVEISPKKAGNSEALALIYENASFYTRGALEWAEDLYNNVVKLDPNNPTSHLRIALVNMAKANMEKDEGEKEYFIGEAIKKYDDAIERKRDLAAAYYGKAVAYEKLGKNDDAIRELKNANIASGDNMDYRFELGRMFYNRGVSAGLNQSAGTSREIAENDIDPANSSGVESLSVNGGTDSGEIVSKGDDLINAEKLFLSILSENPKHANACYSLAVLYQKVGENDNANIMVNRLLEIVDDQKTKEAIQLQFKDL